MPEYYLQTPACLMSIFHLDFAFHNPSPPVWSLCNLRLCRSMWAWHRQSTWSQCIFGFYMRWTNICFSSFPEKGIELWSHTFPFGAWAAVRRVILAPFVLDRFQHWMPNEMYYHCMAGTIQCVHPMRQRTPFVSGPDSGKGINNCPPSHPTLVSADKLVSSFPVPTLSSEKYLSTMVYSKSLFLLSVAMSAIASTVPLTKKQFMPPHRAGCNVIGAFIRD